MSIDFDCPNCRRRLSVSEEYAGKKASCPACGGVAEVPLPTAAAPTAAVADIVPTEMVAPSASAVGPASPTSPSLAATTNLANEPEAASASEPAWLLRTPEGISYGPVRRSELEDWVRQGRVTADCDVRHVSDPLWQAADTIFPAVAPWPAGVLATSVARASSKAGQARSALYPAATTRSAAARGESRTAAPASTDLPDEPSDTQLPDRGILVLTLGIVGLVVMCPVFSIMAWVMGTTDVQEMRAGRMDLRGLTTTQWGRILGMIGAMICVGLALLGTVWGLYMATL